MSHRCYRFLSLKEGANLKANKTAKLIQWGKAVETIHRRDFDSEDAFRTRALELKNYPKASCYHKLFVSPGKYIKYHTEFILTFLPLQIFFNAHIWLVMALPAHT